VLELPNVDVGAGWLIFGLPPAEVAVHPSDRNNVHEFYFMCDNVNLHRDHAETRRRLRAGAEPRLGLIHTGDPAGRRKARHLSTAARAAKGGEHGKAEPKGRKTGSQGVRRQNRQAGLEEE
jgi:hypothetical protein